MTKFTSFSEKAKEYEIIKQELLYQGIFRLMRYHLRHRLFNDEWSPVFTREIVERQLAAAVLPYDPMLDRVILIEQFRAGALKNTNSPWLLEVVAGLYNTDEIASEVAKREAIEEAGCQILDLHPICELFVSPGGSTEYVHLFLGKIDASKTADGVFGLAEEHEDIRAISMPAQEAFNLLEEGKIKTSPAIICLQWLQLHHSWIKQLWQKTK